MTHAVHRVEMLLAGGVVAMTLAFAVPQGAAGMEGVGSYAPPFALQDADTVVVTRADSARLRVLDRVRGGTVEREDEEEDDDENVADVGAERITPPVGSARARIPVRLPSGADSIMRALAALPGYQVATFEGQSADYEAQERRLFLQGTPENRALFSGRGTQVEADSSIHFDDVAGRVRTTGSSTLTGEDGEPVESRSMIYDLGQERGQALGARTTYMEWYVLGDLDSVEQGRIFGSGSFTSCDLDPPHSHFAASEFKIAASQVLVARNVRMYVEDVPVLWLPFIAQNLGSGRASGLLTPRFSMNDIVRTSDGYNRRISNIGYYWAMSEYSDLTLTLDWFSNNYTSLSTGARYNWRRQFLNGHLNLRQYWRDAGGSEVALDTRHSWEASERTRADISGRFVTSSAFVADNSFDPREVTQTIDSNAGLSHRFDWGSLNITSNRRQYLTDDRVDMTLPAMTLSLTTMTLFAAPPASAQWYNNLSLGGGMRFTRDAFGRAEQPFDSTFALIRADEVRTQASANASLGLRDLTVAGQVRYSENAFPSVPGSLFPSGVDPATVERMGGFTAGDGLPASLDPFLQAGPLDDFNGLHDFSRATLSWNTNLSYRQNLIGSTTLTPSVSISSEARRSDSIPEASKFVPGPQRIGMGLRLQTDLYGFYPGLGGFDAIRHKITPSISYDFSPAVRPTPLQRDVFGAREAHPRKILTIGFNQTWEARRPEGTEPLPDEGLEPEDDPFELFDEDQVLDDFGLPDDDPEAGDDLAAEPSSLPSVIGDEGLERAPRASVVNILALSTNAVTYDMVQADSTGQFLRGFQTTRISSTVRSDYLRNLDLSFEHDLFEDPPIRGMNGEGGERRRFAPHLSRLSFGFQLNDQSGPVRAVRRLLGIEDDAPADPDPEEGEEADLLGEDPEGFDQNQIVPGGASERSEVRREGWSARFSYSLRRPRDETGPSTARRAQMLQWTFSFAPTANWGANWRSSYDLEANRFNDHMVTLRRDLHEWEASFGFRQTTTGNWSFQFEVSLRANRDLRFDHEQRSTTGGGGSFPSRPGF
ncbi:MAG: putative LPS assembly protein LptD [Gemmatimonadota bacterium]